MRVTIIVPTYERAGFVETAIESVLRQDHRELEVVAIDDGSTDETPEVLRRIAARNDAARFRWLRHDNVGQAATINRGLELARGELIGYLSSDDYLLPGAVSRLVRAAQEHPEADVVYPWNNVVDASDRVIDTLTFVEHTLVDAVRWGACLIGSGALVRRRYYERVGGWDPEYASGPDFEWWIRGGDTRFVCVPEPLAVWRTHSGSLTTTTDAVRRTREQLRMLDELYARDDVSPELLAVRNQAYASVLIAGGAVLQSASDEQPRFDVHDRVSGRWSQRGRQAEQQGIAHLTAHIHRVEHLLRVHETVSDQRFHTIAALQALADDRAARIAELERERAAAPAPGPSLAARARPLWLRVGRRCTPPALRHRVGVAVHRIGGAR